MSGFQTEPSVFPGFAIFELRCQQCGYQWIGVAPVGTVGVECPRCGYNERRFVWQGERPEMPHDGAWLTGSYLLPWWPKQIAQSTEERPQEAATADEIDPYTGEPRNWLRRWLGRLQAAWWALKGEW